MREASSVREELLQGCFNDDRLMKPLSACCGKGRPGQVPGLSHVSGRATAAPGRAASALPGGRLGTREAACSPDARVRPLLQTGDPQEPARAGKSEGSQDPREGAAFNFTLSLVEGQPAPHPPARLAQATAA